jgi:hypothetical protein
MSKMKDWYVKRKTKDEQEFSQTIAGIKLRTIYKMNPSINRNKQNM